MKMLPFYPIPENPIWELFRETEIMMELPDPGPFTGYATFIILNPRYIELGDKRDSTIHSGRDSA